MSIEIPEGFKVQMQQILGEEYPAFVEALSVAAPTSIRLNNAKKVEENDFAELEKVLWHEDGRYLESRPSFTLDPLFHAGAYYVQEASSMFVAEAIKQTVDLSKPLRVLDLCAAPGGKSTLLASLLNEQSILVANEVIKTRVGVLKENLEKWGFPNYIVSNQDTETMAELEGFFDIVLVDAPCSGEGLFRKDPKAVNEWSGDSVQLCSARQKRILQAAAYLVAPKGVLIYSTCTYNEKENQENVKWLTTIADFESVPLTIPAEWKIVERAGGYQFFPHRTKGEGFFLSVFRQKAKDRNYPKTKVKLYRLPIKQSELIYKWLKNPEYFNYYVKSDRISIVGIPKQLEDEFGTVLKALEKRSSGLELGMFKGNDFIPSHALALSTAIADDLPAIELSKEDALRFLKKENLALDAAENGWFLARYKGLNLGWMKVIGDRMNNYLPKEFRIRMDID